MTDLSKEGRAALRAICENATAGNWLTTANAELCTAAHTALPACLDEIERQEAEIERLRGALGAAPCVFMPHLDVRECTYGSPGCDLCNTWRETEQGAE